MNGVEQKWAYDEAVKDKNAAGGILMDGKHYKVEIKYYDDAADMTQVSSVMEQLIKVDGLKLILSSQTTPINQAAAQVAEKYKAFYLAVIAWADWMEKEKYEWVADMFFTPAIAGQVPFDMVATMPESERPQKWGMFTEDNADGQGLAQGVKALGPLSDYLGHDAFWSQDIGAPGAKELGERYAASHDGATSTSIGICYANAQIMFQAIENAGSTDPAAVRDAVFGHTFTGTTMGDVTYNENGICVTPGIGNEWLDDGVRTLIVPQGPDSKPLQWFKPWDQRGS